MAGPEARPVGGNHVSWQVMVVVLTVVTYTLAPTWKKPARTAKRALPIGSLPLFLRPHPGAVTSLLACQRAEPQGAARSRNNSARISMLAGGFAYVQVVPLSCCTHGRGLA